jgi:hypothetical protein
MNKQVRHCPVFKGTVGTKPTHPSTHIDDCDQQSRGVEARLAAVDNVGSLAVGPVINLFLSRLTCLTW